MLRIDVQQTDSAITRIRLSGRLADTGIRELREAVASIVNTRQNVCLELTGLTGIGQSGVALMVELAGSGVRLAHCPAFLTLWLRAECRSRIRELSRIHDSGKLHAAEHGPGTA
jgi:hypothetical protein